MIFFTLAVRKGTLERVFRVRPLRDKGVALCSTEQGPDLNVYSDLAKLKNELARLRIESIALKEELASISGPDTG